MTTTTEADQIAAAVNHARTALRQTGEDLGRHLHQGITPTGPVADLVAEWQRVTSTPGTP